MNEISNHAFKQTRDYNGEVNQKPFRQIWAQSHIFWHIQPYSGMLRNHSGIFRYIQNPE